MQKVILGFFIFIMVTLSSTATYLYFSTKSAVDSLLHSISPYIYINYQNFSNPMDGSVSIHGVTLSYGEGVAFDIDSIEFKLDSAFDYIDFNKRLKAGEIPEKLQLKVNHAYADLEYFEELNEKPGKFGSISEYVAALNCGDIKKFDYDNLYKLGYTGIDNSLEMSFEYNQFTSIADMKIDFLLHDIFSYSFKTSVADIDIAKNIVDPNNSITNLEIEMQDLGFNKKLSDFCATESGVEHADYVEQHIQELKNYFTDANVKLSNEMYDAYRAFFVDQAALKFKFQPTNSINLKYLEQYETKDWPLVFGLSMYVNNDKVQDLNFDWDRAKVIKDLISAQKDPQVRRAEKKTGSKLNNQLAYVEIPAAKLNQYVNSQVKLSSTRGKSYEGLITGLSGGQIIMEVQLHGGKIKLPIRTDEIANAFVYK